MTSALTEAALEQWQRVRVPVTCVLSKEVLKRREQVVLLCAFVFTEHSRQAESVWLPVSKAHLADTGVLQHAELAAEHSPHREFAFSAGSTTNYSR